MEKKKNKYVKLGVIRKTEKGPYIILGNSRSKNPKYNYNVRVEVSNAEGEVLARFENKLVSLFDPRNSKTADLTKIPEDLLYDVVLKLEE